MKALLAIAVFVQIAHFIDCQLENNSSEFGPGPFNQLFNQFSQMLVNSTQGGKNGTTLTEFRVKIQSLVMVNDTGLTANSTGGNWTFAIPLALGQRPNATSQPNFSKVDTIFESRIKKREVTAPAAKAKGKATPTGQPKLPSWLLDKAATSAKLLLGEPKEGDVFLYRQIMTVPSKNHPKLEETIEYPGKGKTSSDVITAIRCADLLNTKAGMCKVLAGGVGSTHVTLKVFSPKSKKYKMLVEIIGGTSKLKEQQP